MSERKELFVMGRKIGLYVQEETIGYNTLERVYLNFTPLEGMRLPSGTVTIDYSRGVLLTHDNNRTENGKFDLISFVDSEQNDLEHEDVTYEHEVTGEAVEDSKDNGKQGTVHSDIGTSEVIPPAQVVAPNNAAPTPAPKAG